MKRIFRCYVIIALVLALNGLVRSDQTVQIPVASILNTRSVTTLTNGKLVTWEFGVDGNGNNDGFLTSAASLFHGDPGVIGLPDSAKFPPNIRHPEIVLNYSNTDGVDNQTHYVQGLGNFTFPVPQAKYSKMFLFLTSSEGTSALQIRLNYADTIVTQAFALPDYFTALPDTGMPYFNLAKNMAKWDKKNNIVENSGHNLDGLEIKTLVGKTLVGIQVSKTAASGYLVFWGATGVSIDPVPILPIPKRTPDVFSKIRIVNYPGQGISFIHVPVNAELNIYSICGLKVAHFEEDLTGELYWNLKDAVGRKASPGIYICRFQASQTVKNLTVPVSK